MSVILRPYQLDAIDAVWSELHNSSTALCVAPTGSGKTETFMAFIDKAIKSKADFKCVVLLNKITLLDQTFKRMSKYFKDTKISIYSGSKNLKDSSGQIIISTIQSVYDHKIDGLNLIIIDEAHNMNFEDGRYSSFIALNKHDKLKTIGFTATPFRSDGYIFGEDKFFKTISYKKDIKESIDEGHLVTPTMKRTDNQFDISKLRTKMGEYLQSDVDKLTSDLSKVKLQVKEALERSQGRKKIVWACASINHCNDVTQMINSISSDAVCIHSKMSMDDRLNAQREFEIGSARHLVFVTIVSEGWDHPPIDCIVLMRPIRSPVLYVQTVGRGLRPFRDKVNLLVLDFGKVVETLGGIDNPHIGEKRSGKKLDKLMMKFCKGCLEYLAIQTKTCPVCGYEFISPVKDVTKNTSYKPNENGDILTKTYFKNFDIQNIRLRKHIAKSGNDCLAVDYIPINLLDKNITEYFVWTSDFSYRKAAKRLMEIGCEIRASLDDQVKIEPKKIPKSIDYLMNGKYPSVTKLNFI